MGSLNNQPGLPLTLLNLTHVAKSASSVDQVVSLIGAPHASASWPGTNSIIGATSEPLRGRTREESLRSIDIVEEKAEVVVGSPQMYGTSRCELFNVAED